MRESSKFSWIFGIAVVGCCWSIQSNLSPKLVGDGREHRIRKRLTDSKCANDEFACDGLCMNKSVTCNGFFDCKDDADESYETCHKRTCVSSRFRCKSGGCIHKNKLCDGFLSCIDGDDETFEICKNNVCPPEKFRCDYGGCIRKHKVCNGDATDCNDGSDESQALCSKNNVSSLTTSAPDPNRCTLPPITADKTYTVKCPPMDNTCGKKPGETVPEFIPIISQCNTGYSNYQDGRVVVSKLASTCLGGSWIPPVVRCKKICNDLRSLDLNMNCSQYLHGPRVPCTSVLLEGAAVIPRCKPLHHISYRVNYRHVICRKDGTWDQEFFHCSPDCGKTPSSIVKLIVNGSREKRGESPWNVAIYSTEASKDPAFICGGTLISAELVVSAAHCFYDSTRSKQLDPRLFYVIVGKATVNFRTLDFPTTKTYTIKKIHLPNDTVFTGESTNYASDIAILHLSERITLSEDVLPACVYWDDKDRFNPGENVSGKLAGFGATENGQLAPELLTADLPYISYATCRKKVSPDFQDSISVDKFCAGHVKGAGARVGDSGGGLVFKDMKSGFFYLRGVVSNKDTTSSSIATFTDVTQYITWMKRIVTNVDYAALDEDTIVDQKSKI